MKLIYDRTREDVTHRTPKGNYGWEDLNRVERAVESLCEELKKLDIHLLLETKTDWTLPGNDWPVPAQMQRYLGNVQKVAEVLQLSHSLPQSMEHLDYQNANRIEYALMAAENRVRSVCDAFQFSGECIAGEENRI